MGLYNGVMCQPHSASLIEVVEYANTTVFVLPIPGTLLSSQGAASQIIFMIKFHIQSPLDLIFTTRHQETKNADYGCSSLLSEYWLCGTGYVVVGTET